jgi:hypothetical protein
MNITPSEEHWMKALQKQLEQREKSDLIAIIHQSLKAGSSSSIQASDCERFLAGHPHTQENSRHAYMTLSISTASGTTSHFTSVPNIAWQAPCNRVKL